MSLETYIGKKHYNVNGHSKYENIRKHNHKSLKNKVEHLERNREEIPFIGPTGGGSPKQTLSEIEEK